MPTRLTVETDGDRYPKDVYLVDEEGQRVATMEGHNELQMRRFALELCQAYNARTPAGPADARCSSCAPEFACWNDGQNCRNATWPESAIQKRETLAENCAQLDAPILKKPVDELRQLYNQLFSNIATDEMLVKCSAQSTAQQRWDMVEPFTW